MSKPFIELVDAQEMHLRQPDTFEVPSSERLALLKVGDQVKVCAAGERFWVLIQTVSGKEYTGSIRNHLVRTPTHGLVFGDVIEFAQRHIYSTLD